MSLVVIIILMKALIEVILKDWANYMNFNIS